MKLSVNSNFRHQMLEIGANKTRVFVIDDFLMDLKPLLNDAHQQAGFCLEQITSYPGVEAVEKGKAKK